MGSLTQELNQGIEYLNEGRPDRAASLYRKLLLRSPNNPHALQLLGVALCQLGDWGKAAEYTERSVRLNPNSADAHNNLGRYYLNLNRPADAVASLERAISLKPDHPFARMNLALAMRALGQTARAIEQLQAHVRIHPNDASGHHHLGTILADEMRSEEAIEPLRRAMELNANCPETVNNLGNALQTLQRPAEALQHYIRALELKPNYPDAASNLGSAMQALGKFEDAELWYREALRLEPGFFHARGNLANLYAAKRQYEQAVELFYELVTENPSSYQTWNNLGNALQELGRYDEALAAFRKSLDIRPDYLYVYNNIGNTLRKQGRGEEALQQYAYALEKDPKFVEALNNTAVTLLDLGRGMEAVPYFEKAIALRPNYADPLINLANFWRDHGGLERAITSLKRALELEPQNPFVWNNLGCALGDQGVVIDAIACYRKTLQFMPENAAAHSNLLLNLHYLPGYAPDYVFAQHREFARIHEEPLKRLRQRHDNTRDPDRRLRIGYSSSDFRRHSVAFFLEPILERHSRAEFELFCYSDVMRPDSLTEKFFQLSGGNWRDIRGYNHESFANQVRADKIDILIDTGGHTANSRLLSFALKPAPVQVTWLGYPDTTGMDAMDYRITEGISDPPGVADSFHTERLVRLADTFLCFRPSSGSPQVATPPASLGQPFTFGSFNNMAKISAETIRLWSEILRCAPGTRLSIKNKALSEAPTRDRLLGQFAEHGIGPERIVMSGLIVSLEGHLAAYNGIDLALDTFPYHGTTTTCEALWMGVPVLTLLGATHMSRVGAMLLKMVNQEQFIVNSATEYVQMAATFAANWREMALPRTALRQRLQRSPLMDEEGFTRRLEQAFRQMWREWCVGNTAKG